MSGTANVGAGLGAMKAVCGRRAERTWRARDYIGKKESKPSKSCELTIGDAKCAAGAKPLVAPIECACCGKLWIKPRGVTKTFPLTVTTGTDVAAEENPPTP